mgnify:CR=1 FL=1
MANLRTNNLSGEQGQNAYRGSVFFDGSSFLSFNAAIWNSTASDSCTFECWLWVADFSTARNIFDLGSTGDFSIQSDGQIRVHPVASNHMDTNNSITTQSWHHIALVQESGRKDVYINGVKSSMTVGGGDPVASNWANTNANTFNLGDDGVYRDFYRGYMSNVRVIKGVALYDDDFTPPFTELKATDPNTSLLCCQNSDDVTQEETGKTITGNGSLATAGYNKTQPKVIPPYGVDAGNTFGGPIQQSSQGYMYFPTGRTEERGRGRAIWGGGQNPSNKVVMDFFQIQTGGITFDFGNLTDARNEVRACGSSTRGVWAGGRDPGLSNIIDFVEIPTTANAVDFGNLTVARAAVAAVSNSTRGCFMAGFAPSNTNHIDFITIATKGDATDFGDMLGTYQAQGRAMSPTRGLAAGNYGASNLIEFITIATTGNSTDFGDRTVAAYSLSGTSDNTRGVFTGGDGPTTNVIDFVTMASAGNATDFGDLITANGSSHADTSDSIIGCIAGGQSNTNTIEKIIIQTTGNAVDYGDLTSGRSQLGATSDSHGGLS